MLPQKFFLHLTFSAIIFLFFTLFTFLILEIGFRLFRTGDLYLTAATGSAPPGAPYLFEPNQTWRNTSSVPGEFDVEVRSNNLGYRGKDITPQKPEDTLRIFAVGDSFTFGVGAEENETVPYLLEENLRAENIPAEVINAGRGHMSPIGYYLKLRDIHLHYDPDLVLVLLDFSDLQDDWFFERQLVYAPDGTPLYIDPSYEDGKRHWGRTLLLNSEFLKYLNSKVMRTIRNIQIIGLGNYIKAKLDGERSKAVISNLDYEQLEGDTAIAHDHYLMIRGRDKLPLIQEHWTRTEKYLLKIRDLLASKDIEMILITYPYGIHVGPDQWGEGRVYWGFEPGKTYTDLYAFELVEDFTERNNIPFINTLEAFLQANDNPLYFPVDGHLNPAGNAVLAQAITEHPLFREILENLTAPLSPAA